MASSLKAFLLIILQSCILLHSFNHYEGIFTPGASYNEMDDESTAPFSPRSIYPNRLSNRRPFESPFEDTIALSSGDYPLPADKLQYHGTTTLSFEWNNSIIVAVDSRASIGTYIGSRTTKKIFPVTSHIIATMAGGAADCTYWIRRTTMQCKHREVFLNCPITVKAFAKQLAANLRQFRHTEQLSVGTMIAGVDATGPTIYFVDDSGGCIHGRCFCVGSGSPVAYAILDSQVDALRQRVNATLEDAVDTALWAIRHATHRDGYSGGYINVFHIDAAGHRHVLRRDARCLPVTKRGDQAEQCSIKASV